MGDDAITKHSQWIRELCKLMFINTESRLLYSVNFPVRFSLKVYAKLIARFWTFSNPKWLVKNVKKFCWIEKNDSKSAVKQKLRIYIGW